MKKLNIFWNIAICFVLVFAGVWMLVRIGSGFVKTDVEFEYEGQFNEGELDGTNDPPVIKETTHRHSVIIIDDDWYLIKAEYLDGNVVRADFYDFYTFSQKYTIALDYGEDNRISNGQMLVYNSGRVEHSSDGISVAYGENGEFNSLLFYENKESLPLYFMQENGIVNVVFNHRITCRLTLSNDHLVIRASQPSTRLQYFAECTYDEASRLESIHVYKKGYFFDHVFHYEGDNCCFDRISANTEGYAGATLVRDKYHDVVSCNFIDKDFDNSFEFVYDGRGRQFLQNSKEEVGKDTYLTQMSYYYDLCVKQRDDTTLQKNDMGQLTEKTSVSIYSPEGVIMKNTSKTKVHENGALITDYIKVTYYDKYGQIHGDVVSTAKTYHQNGKLMYHGESITSYQNGKKHSTHEFTFVSKRYAPTEDGKYPDAFEVTENEYDEYNALVKKITTLYVDDSETRYLWTSHTYTETKDDLDYYYYKKYNGSGVLIRYEETVQKNKYDFVSYVILEYTSSGKLILEVKEDFDENGDRIFEKQIWYYESGAVKSERVSKYLPPEENVPYEQILTKYGENGMVTEKIVYSQGIYDVDNNLIGKITFTRENGMIKKEITEALDPKTKKWRKTKEIEYTYVDDLPVSIVEQSYNDKSVLIEKRDQRFEYKYGKTVVHVLRVYDTYGRLTATAYYVMSIYSEDQNTLIGRVIYERSADDYTKVLRATYEYFDENGNVIRTKVVPYDTNGRPMD